MGLTVDTGERLKSLHDTTSTFGKFKIVAKFFVTNMAEAEKHCFKELKNFRVDPNREFFKGNEKEIINTVRKVVSNYKSLPADVFPKYPETNPETKKTSYELEEQVKKIRENNQREKANKKR